MNLSPDGLDRLKEREGVSTHVYRDSAGLPSIGVGHLLTKDELSSGKLMGLGIRWTAGLTTAEVNALLGQDVAWAEAAVEEAERASGLHLSQSQFDSLTSFVFNIGAGAFARSTLRKKLVMGQLSDVPEQMRRWDYSANVLDPILVKRRESEVAQFLEGEL